MGTELSSKLVMEYGKSFEFQTGYKPAMPGLMATEAEFTSHVALKNENGVYEFKVSLFTRCSYLNVTRIKTEKLCKS